MMELITFQLFGTFRVYRAGQEIDLPSFRYLDYLKLLLLSNKQYLSGAKIGRSLSEKQIKDVVDRANLPSSATQNGRYDFQRKTGLELRYKSGSGLYLKGASWTSDLREFQTIWENRTSASTESLVTALGSFGSGLDRSLQPLSPPLFQTQADSLDLKRRDIEAEIARRRNLPRTSSKQGPHEGASHGPTGPRPLLEIPKPTANPARKQARRFLYGERLVPLIGRAYEFTTLETFINSEPAFSWWAVTGGAGSGKSRLALDFVLSARSSGWHAGNLSTYDNFEEWRDWIPSADTLIVVDYVVERFESLRHMLRTLTKKSGVTKKIRVLLLERNRADLWWQSLTAEESQPDRELFDALFRRAPLELTPLDVESVSHIIRAKRPELSNEEARRLGRVFIRTIDRQGRPLFAAMFAEAANVSKQKDGLSWTDIDLTATVLRRERRFWVAGGVRDSDLNLLVFASIAGVITPTSLQSQDLSRLVAQGSLSTVWDDSKMEALAALGEVWDPFEPRLTAMQPDFLGEYLVLERLAGRLRLSPVREPLPGQIAEVTSQLLLSAWRSDPGKALGFQLRCLADHPAAARELGLNSPPPTITATPFAYSRLLRACKDLPTALALLDRIEDEYEKPEAQLYNIVIDRAQYPEDAMRVYERMRHRRVQPSTYTLNTIASKTSNYREASTIVQKLQMAGCEPDIVTFNTLLQRAAGTEFEATLKEMRIVSIPWSPVTYNTVMAREPSFENVMALYTEMLGAGMEPTKVTRRIVINKAPDVPGATSFLQDEITRSGEIDQESFDALIGKGTFAEAMASLLWSLQHGCTPSPSTFRNLLSRAKDRGEEQQGLALLRQHGFYPGSQTIAEIVSRSRSLEEAMETTTSLAGEGLGLTVQVLLSLIALATSPEEAEGLIESLKMRYPKVEGVYYSPAVIAALVSKAQTYEERRQLLESYRRSWVLAEDSFCPVIRKAPDLAAVRELLDMMLSDGVRIGESTLMVACSRAKSLQAATDLLGHVARLSSRPVELSSYPGLVATLVARAESVEEGMEFLIGLRRHDALTEMAFLPLFRKAADFKQAVAVLTRMRAFQTYAGEQALCAVAAKSQSLEEALRVMAPSGHFSYNPTETTFMLLISRADSLAEILRVADIIGRHSVNPSQQVIGAALSKCDDEATEAEVRRLLSSAT